MPLDNDTRGWIMTAMSGIACVLGASVICVDLIVRLFPGRKDFRIQDSNIFLSCSLSLSFGVMLFSSLYSMLPSAKTSLQKGGYSPKAAAWILIACFLGGVIGIQLVSRVMHHFIPSHVVDCDHTHDEEAPSQDHHLDKHGHSDHEDHENGLPRHEIQFNRSFTNSSAVSLDASAHSDMLDSADPHRPQRHPNPMRRPSFPAQLAHKASQIMSRSKALCDENGACYGYSDPCGLECFKIVRSRGGTRAAANSLPKQPGLFRNATTPHHTTTTHAGGLLPERQPLLHHVNGGSPLSRGQPGPEDMDYHTIMNGNGNGNGTSKPLSTHSISDHGDPDDHNDHNDHQHHHNDTHDPNHHHHHVPTNAFLSIGLQTSIAIALHKLPEGFITYATNHANPQLGFAVFLALFIHNITEGFAMALPLYLAISSRWKAMVISSILGGASQPLGAGVAALWFKFAGRAGIGEPGEAVYGGMFAVTAGIMSSVHYNSSRESMGLTHNRGLCMIFAFVGMGILGISSALTA